MFVYLFQADGGFYKIGRSADPEARVGQFSSLPFNVKLIHQIQSDSATWLENKLHKRFRHCRVEGEWFRLTDADVTFIKSMSNLNRPKQVRATKKKRLRRRHDRYDMEASGTSTEAIRGQEGQYAAILRQEIRASGKSLNQLAKECGVGPDRLSRFMRGERGLMFTAAERLCKAVGLDLVDTQKGQPGLARSEEVVP